MQENIKALEYYKFFYIYENWCLFLLFTKMG